MTDKRKLVFGIVSGVAAAVAIIWGFDIAPEQLQAITDAIVSVLGTTEEVAQ